MIWHIFFIMWVSGAWKSTLINSLKDTNNNFFFPLSYKTRAIRQAEINWIDAYFISQEDFYKSIQNEEFLEYAIVHETDHYGTKYIDLIDEGINKWKILIKELDILWLKRLRKEKPNLDYNYTTLFLNIPIEVLKQRIISRWAFMQDEELKRRINSAIIEEEEANKICNFIIDASRSKESILQEVLDIINKKIWKLI